MYNTVHCSIVYVFNQKRGELKKKLDKYGLNLEGVFKVIINVTNNNLLSIQTMQKDQKIHCSMITQTMLW